MSVNEIAAKAREYRELQAYIKQLEEEAEAIKTDLTAQMAQQGVDTLEADIFTIRLTEYQSSRIDSKRLKADHEDLCAAYTKTTTGRRFQIA